MSAPDIAIDEIGGNCPVQAEGMIDGRPFYFRARGNYWSVSIGATYDVDALKDSTGTWEFCRKYSDDPYAAGWMEEDEARKFIAEAATAFRQWMGTT